MHPDGESSADRALALIPLAALAPALVAGILRYTAGVSLGLAVVVGLVLGLGALFWWGRQLAPTPQLGWALFGAALTAAVCVWGVEVRAFEGLPTVGGGDAGNHMGNARWFAEHDPHIYQGFVVFYALTWAAQRLTGADLFGGFRLGFDATVALVGWAAFSLAWLGGDARRAGTRTAVAILIALLGAFTIWLPLLAYNQADGFYAHILGLALTSISLLWVALPTAPWIRGAALCALPVVLRFTYGLNLGDVLLACAVLLLWEAAPNVKGRWPLLAVAAVFLVAAGFSFVKLEPLRAAFGELVRPRRRSFLASLVLIVTGLAMAGTASVPRPARRAIRTAAVIAGVPTLVQAILFAGSQPDTYYVVKHGFAALLTAVIGAGVVLGGTWRQHRAGTLLVLAGAAVATVSLRPYLPDFGERLRAHPPWHRLGPLQDPDASARIRSVLAGEAKRFGGYVDPSWPLMNAMNAALGFPADWSRQDAGQQQFLQGLVIQAADSCVFWSDAPEDAAGFAQLAGGFGSGTARRWAELRGQPGVRCENYLARWDGRTRRRMCWMCGEARR